MFIFPPFKTSLKINIAKLNYLINCVGKEGPIVI